MTNAGLDEQMMRRDKLTCLREWVGGATILCQFARWGKPVPEAMRCAKASSEGSGRDILLFHKGFGCSVQGGQ